MDRSPAIARRQVGYSAAAVDSRKCGSMKDFSGKVAVVTGGASGIGRATGERFAALGMKVVLADIEKPALDGAVAAMRDRSLDVTGIPTDLTQWESVKATAD